MMKFQKIIILFLALLPAAFIADRLFHTGFWVYSGIFEGLTGFLAYGSMNIRSGYYCKVLFKTEPCEKKIALTFDDGPDERYTPEILNILRSYNIQAVFFCIGQKAGLNPGLIEKIDIEGHAIGSHSYSHHFFFDLFSRQKMTEDLLKCEQILNSILKKKIRIFRPPYGVTNPTLAKTLKKFSYDIIGWSLKSRDTVTGDADLLKRLKEKVRPGDIILLHDNRPQTAAVLEKFILYAIENNFKFERADRMLKIEPYE
jgi:peptidoglycan-N-acetylglucosamine deacetylase